MSDSHALVPSPAGALAVGGLGFDGDFTIRPTTMKLVQRTTTTPDAIPGKLLDTLSGNHFDSVQVVPLAIKTGRVLFPPGGDLGAEPLCRSEDGMVPSPFAAVPQATKCALCDHGEKMWKSYRATGQKPECREVHKILFVLRDTGLPYFISVSGMSIPNLRRLKEQIYRDVLVAKAAGNPRNLFDYTFEIKPAFVQGKKGSYYVLAFPNLKVVNEPGQFGPLYEQFVMRQRFHEAEVESESAIEGELTDTDNGDERVSV